MTTLDGRTLAIALHTAKMSRARVASGLGFLHLFSSEMLAVAEIVERYVENHSVRDTPEESNEEKPHLHA